MYLKRWYSGNYTLSFERVHRGRLKLTSSLNKNANLGFPFSFSRKSSSNAFPFVFTRFATALTKLSDSSLIWSSQALL